MLTRPAATPHKDDAPGNEPVIEPDDRSNCFLCNTCWKKLYEPKQDLPSPTT